MEGKEELVDELIGNEDSPYDQEDKEALMGMNEGLLEKVLGAYKAQTNEEGDEPEANEGDEDEQKSNEEDEDKMTGNKNKPVTMSKEDRDALQFARNQYKEHRSKLIEKITAHSAMKEKELEGMDTSSLEVIANGILPEPDFSGRAGGGSRMQTNDDMAKAMTHKSTTAIIQARNKTKQEA